MTWLVSSTSIRVALPILLSALALLTIVMNVSASGKSDESSSAKDSKSTWSATSINEVRAALTSSGKHWEEILNNQTLEFGVYALPKGGVDRQTPHRYDEIYYITKGRATLIADGDRRPSKAGDIIFVKRGIDHRFVDIEENLEVLVFFSKAKALSHGSP